jgi:hypothetical protein
MLESYDFILSIATWKFLRNALRLSPELVGGNGTSGYWGVAIYDANYLNSQRRFDLEINGLEFICTEITVDNTYVLVSVCYRPPTSSGDANLSWLANIRSNNDAVLPLYLVGSLINYERLLTVEISNTLSLSSLLA